jgi:hypothetical protein
MLDLPRIHLQPLKPHSVLLVSRLGQLREGGGSRSGNQCSFVHTRFSHPSFPQPPPTSWGSLYCSCRACGILLRSQVSMAPASAGSGMPSSAASPSQAPASAGSGMLSSAASSSQAPAGAAGGCGCDLAPAMDAAAAAAEAGPSPRSGRAAATALAVRSERERFREPAVRLLARRRTMGENLARRDRPGGMCPGSGCCGPPTAGSLPVSQARTSPSTTAATAAWMLPPGCAAASAPAACAPAAKPAEQAEPPAAASPPPP